MLRLWSMLGVILVPILCWGSEREEINENAVEAASLIAAHYANVDAIRTFDVVFKYSSVFETSPGDNDGELAFGSEEFTSRCITDPRNERNVFVNKTNKEHALSRQVATSVDILSSAIGRDGKVYKRQFPHNVFATDLTEERPFEFHADVPGFRILALSPFPAPGIAHPAIEQARANIQTPNPTYRLVTNGNLRVVTKRSAGTESWGETRLEIDGENLVVLRVTTKRAKKVGNKVERQSVYDERITWGKVNNVLVPLTIEGQEFGTKILGDKENILRARVLNEYSCELKWLSLGKQVPEDEYPISLLNDQKKLASMVDFQAFENIAERVEGSHD